ncbi:hypothetical protein EXIGLDRAFT_842094 [Exidia glandulosa HHB12029]|uniref:Uncharacterized protein n=1 Tax=Exidia glandulosa HHB12029 TaxID=1314781 RepID=A0A165DHZ6_EXIGL|nr:hypothetical protein EXIGLDRAFT_842094 [Exidia glandulosa HHB12029]
MSQDVETITLDSVSKFLSGDAVIEFDSDSDSDSDDETPELASDMGRDDLMGDEEILPGIGRTRMREALNRPLDTANPYFPWRDRCDFTFDLLTHLPRSVLSERQLDLLIWSMKYNGVDNVPTVNTIKSLNAMLHSMCGIETVEYMGKMGHRYFVNSLADLIAQEAANPRISAHLEYLPCDGGGQVGNAAEANKWLREVDPSLATPMIRLRAAQDFYVFEPALLTDRTVCMPIRWFRRGSTRYAHAWSMIEHHTIDTDTGVSAHGWGVCDYVLKEVSEEQLHLSFPEFCNRHSSYNLPTPTSILGRYGSDEDVEHRRLSTWTRTDATKPNPRRVQASGAEVLAFPIWLYCDDTSGNLSKKWNKHNSFLFTPVGLPRSLGHEEFNVHFLATSNTAPVTEMLDGIVDQVNQCGDHGVWAYNAATGRVVLLLPFVLALLGDNPMQSELSCHIGMKGKYFCRVCWVKGVDRQQEADAEDDDGHSTDGSEASATGENGRRKKFVESAQEVLARIKRFVKPGSARTRAETEEVVNTLEALAKSKDGTQTEIKALKTSKGIKDTSLQVFIDRLASAMKGKRNAASREKALDEAVKNLPEADLRSAIFQLKGLDPHCDTPVEVLHVILLGIVKYFWRDAVKNQCKSKTARRELIARLDSFDTSSLGISPLRGETLVTYAGSLVGRDFRAIAQAAPFVLHGMVSAESYEAWVALSLLVPLVWQPVIEDMDTYISRLTKAINNLLAATACWTPRWFNKPKFHLLVHLPDHIRRFGPAIIFATEAFESFNAVIRAKSVHSNRQAPSRDIARAFAHGNRIRHLVSGGYFRIYRPQEDAAVANGSASIREQFRRTKPAPADFLQANRAMHEIPKIHDIVRSYLGMQETTFIDTAIGSATEVPFSATKTFEHVGCSPLGVEESEPVDVLEHSLLVNGDKCKAGAWAIARRRTRTDSGSESTTLFVGKIAEVTRGETSENDVTYNMPVLNTMSRWDVFASSDVLCTVNVQHNCAKQKCKATHQVVVQQERQASQQTRPVLAHTGNTDWILNLAQMRDAAVLRQVAIPQPRLDMDECIEVGVKRELASQKRAKKAKKAGPEVIPELIIAQPEVGGRRVEERGSTSRRPILHNVSAAGPSQVPGNFNTRAQDRAQFVVSQNAAWTPAGHALPNARMQPIFALEPDPYPLPAPARRGHATWQHSSPYRVPELGQIQAHSTNTATAYLPAVNYGASSSTFADGGQAGGGGQAYYANSHSSAFNAGHATGGDSSTHPSSFRNAEFEPPDPWQRWTG